MSDYIEPESIFSYLCQITPFIMPSFTGLCFLFMFWIHTTFHFVI